MRKLLRGGKAAAAPSDCAQSQSSFAAMGNWCSVQIDSIPAPGYVGAPVR